MKLRTLVQFRHQGRWLDGVIWGKPCAIGRLTPHYDVKHDGAIFGNVSVNDIRAVERPAIEAGIRMVKS